ncbi:unnamed protein product [Adineta steineri]|uniref:TIR domain-containing protein n=1 Tax=Adineta steineri TaxID=433720 RepID=A0A819VQP8_9BILA|nr:unnamed protein product [Adineta steineri]CAF4043386.1 unnamed protein product [Adineta steineri]CAF4112678.1 unnamed protein product [Adineta steineri]
MFITAGYAETTIKWLKEVPLKEGDEEIYQAVLYIVYNLSRDKKGLEALRSAKTFDILMQRKQDVQSTQDDDLIEPFTMLLIALLDSEEQQEKNEKLILKVSDRLFKKSKMAFDNKKWKYDGCHLSEYLYSLQRVLSNASIIQRILDPAKTVKQDEIKFFVDVLCSTYGLLLDEYTNELERLVVKSSMSIILCISNYEEYRSKLVDDDFFCILIEILAKQHNQDIAERIWCNLRLEKDPKPLSDKSEKQNPPMIYVSYNRNDKDFYKNFTGKLAQHTDIAIWAPSEKAGESQDLWESLEPAIDAATTIIILASSAYAHSKRNHQEFNYIISKIKPSEETASIIIVETDLQFQFYGQRMHSFVTEENAVIYTGDDDQLVKKVANHSALTRKKKYTSTLSTLNTNAPSSICTIM